MITSIRTGQNGAAYIGKCVFRGNLMAGEIRTNERLPCTLIKVAYVHRP